MKRYVHASDYEDDYVSYEDVQDDFMEIESDVLHDLGLYIDFSAVRFGDGPIFIYSDPNHENNSDMWDGDDDALLKKMSFSDYTFGIEEEVLSEDESSWPELYKQYIESLIGG